MTDNQLIRKFLKERYPIGTEVWDSVRHGGPYVINKRTVFEIHRWEKEDYNPDFLPDDRDKYWIDICVRNPGKYSINYKLKCTDMQTVKFYFSKDRTNFFKKKRNAAKNKSV
jgi:hypothetical protein